MPQTQPQSFMVHVGKKSSGGREHARRHTQQEQGLQRAEELVHLIQLCLRGRRTCVSGSAMGTRLSPAGATAAHGLFYSHHSKAKAITFSSLLSQQFICSPAPGLDVWKASLLYFPQCKCFMCSPTDVPFVASIVNICHLYLLSLCFPPRHKIAYYVHLNPFTDLCCVFFMLLVCFFFLRSQVDMISFWFLMLLEA